MQVDRLLSDATGLASGTSRNQVHIRVAHLLTERHPGEPISAKGVEKWAQRKSIPTKWLMRVCALPKKTLNPAHYA